MPHQYGSQEIAPEQFNYLLAQAQSGSREAALAVFKHCESHFQSLATRQLRMLVRLRSLFDPEDFVEEARLRLWIRDLPSSAWNSLQNFQKYMDKVVIGRVMKAKRKYLVCMTHNLNNEVQGKDLRLIAERLSDQSMVESDMPIKNDILQNLPSEAPKTAREILPLLVKGHTQREIAELLGTSERTIGRVLAQLRTIFSSYQ